MISFLLSVGVYRILGQERVLRYKGRGRIGQNGMYISLFELLV